MTGPQGPSDSAARDSSVGPGDRVDRLLCGRDPVDVVDRARAGRSDEHERTCPYCRGAIEQAAVTATAADDLAAADRAITAPPTLLPRVMQGVWNDLRRAADIPLDTPGGTTFVSERAVISVVMSYLDALPDLQIHTCTVALQPPAANSDEAQAHPDQQFPDRPGLAVRVTASGRYDSDLNTLAEEARDVVSATLLEQFHLDAESVDIDIIDVFTTEEPA